MSLSSDLPPDAWRRCSMCRKPIPFDSAYWVCSVSTCNRKRTGMIFCQVACWDAHVPMLRHRESWAEERRSPGRKEWETAASGEETPRTPRQRKPRAASAPPAKTVILRRPKRD